MSVAQAARLPKVATHNQSTYRVPSQIRTSPVRSLLSATRTPSLSPKRRDVQPPGSCSSNSTASVNLARTLRASGEVSKDPDGAGDDMEKGYDSERGDVGGTPRSGTPSDVSLQLEPRKVALQDFELIRVIGKGCAGRVSQTSSG